MSAEVTDATPGWYGKLPTLGDFASRRLKPEFIEPWDLWLAERMASLREAYGEAWLQSYLDSPVWRFVLMPDCLGAGQTAALGGVLMASVDRVGRYFPLTLCAPLAHTPGTAAEVQALLAWLHRLEDVAMDAIQDDWTIDQLDAALALMPPHLAAPAADDDAFQDTRRALHQALTGATAFVPIEAVRSRADLSTLFVDTLFRQAIGGRRHLAAGRGFWWAEPPDGARLMVSHGMPDRLHFAGMMGPSQPQDDAASAQADSAAPL